MSEEVDKAFEQVIAKIDPAETERLERLETLRAMLSGHKEESAAIMDEARAEQEKNRLHFEEIKKTTAVEREAADQRRASYLSSFDEQSEMIAQIAAAISDAR